ncbi:hypothetical protein HQ447_11870 [bacterium]|nr:hypothetical protein [bacterium]
MSSYGSKRGGMYQKSGHMGYPGDCIFVFDPQFPAFCDEYAKQLVSTKNDPWLVGHFSDNELPFLNKTLDHFMKLPETDPGRKAVDQWLTERRVKHPGDTTLADQKRQEFLGFVTEWYAKGMDSGMANTTGAGFVVKTQADRGRFYQNFTLGLLESGGCVGWHWFKYRDNDPKAKGADPSNIDSSKGIVNLALEPYKPLIESMHELNRQVYSLADYFDKRQP